MLFELATGIIIASIIILGLIAFICISSFEKWYDFNHANIDDYPYSNRLHLKYSEIKHLYFLNPNRWFWDYQTYKTGWNIREKIYLFYDASEYPKSCQTTAKRCMIMLRTEVSRVLLTYPAYIYIKYNRIKALKMQKNIETIKAQKDAEEKLNLNKEKFVEICKQDLDKLYRQAAEEISCAKQITERVQNNCNIV